MEITEDKLKSILSEQRQEFQIAVEKGQLETRHVFGIMKEDFDSKMQLIGEQYQGIKTTLDGHTEMIGSLAEDVQIIKSDIQVIKGDLKRKVDYDEFSAIAQRVSALESKARK